MYSNGVENSLFLDHIDIVFVVALLILSVN